MHTLFAASGEPHRAASPDTLGLEGADLAGSWSAGGWLHRTSPHVARSRRSGTCGWICMSAGSLYIHPSGTVCTAHRSAVVARGAARGLRPPASRPPTGGLGFWGHCWGCGRLPGRCCTAGLLWPAQWRLRCRGGHLGWTGWGPCTNQISGSWRGIAHHQWLKAPVHLQYVQKVSDDHHINIDYLLHYCFMGSISVQGYSNHPLG